MGLYDLINKRGGWSLIQCRFRSVYIAILFLIYYYIEIEPFNVSTNELLMN